MLFIFLDEKKRKKKKKENNVEPRFPKKGQNQHISPARGRKTARPEVVRVFLKRK